MGDTPEHPSESDTRTALLQRLPSFGALVLSLAVALLVAHTAWVAILLLFGTYFLCVLVLRYVFGLPLERIIKLREYDRP